MQRNAVYKRDTTQDALTQYWQEGVAWVVDGLCRVETGDLEIALYGGADETITATVGTTFSVQRLALHEVRIQPAVSGVNGKLVFFGVITDTPLDRWREAGVI